MSWQLVPTGDGSWTLRHPVHGQACHSLDGAWTESVERYARPCGLAALAAARGTVRVLDVGTGPGLSLAAALAEIEPAGGILEAVSCELDQAVLRRTLELGPIPGPGRRWHALVLEALERALAGAPEVPLGTRGRLRLLVGDARALLPRAPREPADAIFLDPFSPRVDPPLWEEGFLRELAGRMGPAAVLSTYSSAFSVRLGLRRAGLRVGPGPRVGRKASGTLASPEGLLAPLDGRTARRLERRIACRP